RVLEWYAMAHSLVAGLGMLVLGRELGLEVVAASVGALTFMGSGFLWAHGAHLTVLQTSAWLPWLLATHGRAVTARSVAWTGAAGVVCALMILGGHPQIAVYVALAVILSGLGALGACRGEASRTARLAP